MSLDLGAYCGEGQDKNPPSNPAWRQNEARRGRSYMGKVEEAPATMSIFTLPRARGP